MTPAPDAPSVMTSSGQRAPARLVIAAAAPVDLTPLSATQAVGRFSGIARADVGPRIGRITAIIGLVVLIVAIGVLTAGVLLAFL